MAPTKADFPAPLVFNFQMVLVTDWGHVGQARVQSHAVIKPVDIVGRSADSLFVRLVSGVMDFFDFEALEEAFHGRVIVTVAFAAHALMESP